MEFIGGAFIVIAVGIALVSATMIVIQAFKTSLLWGFCTLLIPIVELAFIVTYWEKTKKYVYWYLIAILSFMIGGILFNLK